MMQEQRHPATAGGLFRERENGVLHIININLYMEGML